MKKVISLIFAICLVLSFSSCNKETVFRYDMGSKPKNLDQQMAFDIPSQVVLKHVMQGLVKENENGEIICDAASKYDISKDNTLYTFTLKDNLKWSNGENVTAQDFAFAFKRIFLNETVTPNKSAFMCIKNAQEISNGEKNINSLGVRAVNDKTLEIVLSTPNPNFLYTLTTSAAYPCNREFFESTKGRYGYNADELLFNGPFIIQKTSNNYIQLIANPKNPLYSQKKDTIIVLYTDYDYDRQERLLNKTTDFGKISIEAAKKLNSSEFQTYQFESSTWVLGFNQSNDIFKNLTLRKALTTTVNSILPNINGYPNYELANGLIVPSIKLNSTPYRDLVSEVTLLSADNSSQLLKQALEELEIDELGKLTVLCPDNEIFKYYITYIQKAWREKIGIIVNFVALGEQEYTQTLYNGEYDLAIFPVSATQNSVTSQLEKFSYENDYNFLNYNDPEFELLIDQISLATNFSQMANLTHKAEQYLVNNAVIIPLVFEKDFFASNISNNSIVYSPYGPIVDFTNAYKK